MINVDAYLFLDFLDLTCHLEIQEQVFSGCTVVSDSKETKFGSSDQAFVRYKHRNSFSAMLGMEESPYSYFRSCEYFRGPWVPFVTKT